MKNSKYKTPEITVTKFEVEEIMNWENPNPGADETTLNQNWIVSTNETKGELDLPDFD